MKGIDLKRVHAPLAVTLAGALLLGGCGKPSGTAKAPAEPVPEPAPADSQPSAPTVTTGTAAAPAADVRAGGGQFATASQASPFAEADPPLKENFNRALIAYQIADYARAAAELRDLADDTNLDAQQKAAVQQMLADALALAPESALSNAAAATGPNAGGTNLNPYPLAEPQPGASPQDTPENSFVTADPAVKETFDRARAAFEIGDYAKVLAELKDLSENPRLNWQQKNAVQEMLVKTPRFVPAGASIQPGPTPKK